MVELKLYIRKIILIVILMCSDFVPPTSYTFTHEKIIATTKAGSLKQKVLLLLCRIGFLKRFERIPIVLWLSN
jgi:hypothetical protein